MYPHVQYDKYEDQKGGQDSDMDRQTLLVWPLLHSIAEPFKLQADTMGVHLRWADDVYTEFFPEFISDHYTRDEGSSSHAVATTSSRPISHRERAKSMKVDNDVDVRSDVADYLALNLNSQKRGPQQHHPAAGLDTSPSPDAFAAAAASERNKNNNMGGIDSSSLGRGSSSAHGFPGSASGSKF